MHGDPPERTRDAAATRAAILDAAEAVFCERGFSAATMSAIASAAGVTKSLLHHHFGSKAGLWQAAAARRFESYARLQGALLEQEDLALSTFRDSVTALFRFLRETPQFVRLQAWANAAGDAPLEKVDAHGLTRRGVARLRELREQGELAADLEPEVVLAAYFGLVEHWFLARPSLRARFGDALPDDETYLEQMRALLLRGIRP